MNTLNIKRVALIFMILDHIGGFVAGSPVCLRQIGRLSAPLFSFCMVQGVKKSHDKRKYLKRLYFCGVMMAITNAIFNMILLRMGVWQYVDNNYFATLFCSAILIYLCQYCKERRESAPKIISIYLIYQLLGGMIWAVAPEWFAIPKSINDIIFTILGNIFAAEGSMLHIILGPIFYFTYENKKRLMLLYGGLCILLFLNSATGILGKIFIRIGNDFVMGLFEVYTGIKVFGTWSVKLLDLNNIVRIDFQWMMIGALPFILLYNGKKGNGLKYFYYLFYPIHIYLFAIFSWIIL